MDARSALVLFKETFGAWQRDKAPRLAAALAYYTVFSIAPLLIIIIAVVGFFLGHHGELRDRLVMQLGATVGSGGAATVKSMVEAAYQPRQGFVASALSFGVFLFAAAGLFGALQDSLNTVWDAQPPTHGGFIAMLRARFAAIAMVLGSAFVLLVSLGLNALLAAVGKWLTILLPAFSVMLGIADFVLSFGVIAVLFAMIYKFLPDTHIEWRDVWMGAAFTALLFVVGQFLIGWYLGRTSATSTYGAAGSLIVVLLWVYYSAQILLFGAEFTKVYAHRHGSKARVDTASTA